MNPAHQHEFENILPQLRDLERLHCSKITWNFAQIGNHSTGRMPSVADPVIIGPASQTTRWVLESSRV